MRFRDWLDHRTGYRELLRHVLHEPVWGGARWAYIFGSALAILFLVQVITGVVLAFYYSPSSQEAWGSVYYLSHKVSLGWLVRGIHHYCSSTMVILLVVHMFQVFIFGAYRPPRELSWWTGLLLLFITLAFSLTGYLLPWDQKGYWATKVVVSIAGTFPFMGDFLKSLLLGGNDFGNLTLTHFFGFHVFALPALLVTILLIHIFLFRRHGVTPHWKRSKEELKSTTEPFWPRQLTYDLVFASGAICVVVLIAVWQRGAPLDAPADPSSNYLARPEWYFRWLFELLKIFPGEWEGPLVLGLSVLTVIFLAALPLVERSSTLGAQHRWPHFVVASTIACVVLWLTIKSLVTDALDRKIIIQNVHAAVEADRAFSLAKSGIPPGGAIDLYLNDPYERGKRLFAQHCQTCHTIYGKGGDEAPDLTGYMTRAWVKGVIADPTTAKYFGGTKVSGMDPTDASSEELEALTDYVLSLGSHAPLSSSGERFFEEKGCQSCHPRANEEASDDGPSLADYGSRSWTIGIIKNANNPFYYGEQNEMPVFEGKLTNAQIDDLLLYLYDSEPIDR